jgi:hypothetical protein
MPVEPAGRSTGTATILFTDLVGSTTLRTALGEERAEAHRRAHHRLLGDVITSNAGTVHDDLGDGIMASFAGAADAVAAAVAIQQAITGRASVPAARRPASASASAPATSPGRATTRTASRSSRRRGCAPWPRAGRSSWRSSCACWRAAGAVMPSSRSARSR